MGLRRRQMKDLAHPVQPALAIHVDADLPGQDQGQGFEGVGVQAKPAIGLPFDDHGLAEAFVAKAGFEGDLVHRQSAAFGLTVCARLMILG